MSQEEFADTKRVIRIRKSKDRQDNGQKKKNKRTNNDLQNIHIKLKNGKHEPHLKAGSIREKNKCIHMAETCYIFN
jgi:hypothetical protein